MAESGGVAAVLEWLIANGRITREELEGAQVFGCRVDDEEGDRG